MSAPQLWKVVTKEEIIAAIDSGAKCAVQVFKDSNGVEIGTGNFIVVPKPQDVLVYKLP